MRTTREVSAFVRPCWAHWLARALAQPGLDQRRLADALAALRKNDEPGGAYIKLVEDWLDSKKTVSQDSAFQVGRILQSLGLQWSSGLLALHGAGYLADTIGTLGQLLRSDGRKGGTAPMLILMLPIANPQFAMRARPISDLQKLALHICSIATKTRSKESWERWKSAHSMLGAGPVLQSVYTLLRARNVSLFLSASPAWDIAAQWALSQRMPWQIREMPAWEDLKEPSKVRDFLKAVQDAMERSQQVEMP